MKKYLLGVLILSITLTLTGCKEEWEEKVMTKEWYAENPKETNKLYDKCNSTKEMTPVCFAVNQFKFSETQKNAKGIDFSNFKVE